MVTPNLTIEELLRLRANMYSPPGVADIFAYNPDAIMRPPLLSYGQPTGYVPLPNPYGPPVDLVPEIQRQIQAQAGQNATVGTPRITAMGPMIGEPEFRAPMPQPMAPVPTFRPVTAPPVPGYSATLNVNSPGLGLQMNPAMGPSAMPIAGMEKPSLPAPAVAAGGRPGMKIHPYALLAAGLSMLQQSGWQPRKVTLGEAIGTGGLAGLQAQMTVGQQEAENELRREQIEGMRRLRAVQEQKEGRELSAYQRQQDAIRGLPEPYRSMAAVSPEQAVTAWGKSIDATSSKDPVYQQKKADLMATLIRDGYQPSEAGYLADGRLSGRFVVAQDRLGKDFMLDTATGREMYPSAQPGQAAPGASALPPGVVGSEATGGSGFFMGLANKISDAIGMGLPYPKAQEAHEALTNLKAQTLIYLQAAVPGRDSVAMMRQLEPLTVTGGSILQADQRSRVKLEQTRNMIRTEVKRLQSDVLDKPDQYKVEEVTAARLNQGQLQQLLTEYETILKNWSGRKSRPPLSDFMTE